VKKMAWSLGKHQRALMLVLGCCSSEEDGVEPACISAGPELDVHMKFRERETQMCRQSEHLR
jgi:hypothetical protein